MKTLLNEHVTSVTCGGSHTVVVTKRGSVYTFGYGMHGQLGHGPSSQDVPLPKLVTALQKRFVTAVSCGESHTALLTRRGELFTCGDGRHGKLGMGDESFSNLFKPEKVTRFKSFHVDHVACGGCHMLAVAVKNEEGIGESEESEEDLVQKSVAANEIVEDVVDGIETSPRLSATVPPSPLSARDKRRQRDLGVSSDHLFNVLMIRRSTSVRPSLCSFVPLSVCLSLCPSVPLSARPSVPFLRPSVVPSVPRSVRPSLLPSVRPSLCPSVRPFVRSSLRPYLRPSVHPSVRPSLRPSARPSVRPSLPLPALYLPTSFSLPTYLPTYLLTFLPVCLSVLL